MTSSTDTDPQPLRLGLRENIAQFSLLVGVNALVGGMIGQERTVLPLLATDEFGLTAFTATLTFIAAFGIVKAATNFFAGTLSDRYGRKLRVLARGGESIGGMLVAEGLAHEWGGGKRSWC